MSDPISGYGRVEKCDEAGGTGAVAAKFRTTARKATAQTRKSTAQAEGLVICDTIGKTPLFSGF